MRRNQKMIVLPMMTLQRLPWLLWTKPPTKNDCRRDFGGGLPVRRAECIHLSSPSVQSPPHPTYHSMFFTDFWSLRRSFNLIHCHCICHPISHVLDGTEAHVHLKILACHQLITKEPKSSHQHHKKQIMYVFGNSKK